MPDFRSRIIGKYNSAASSALAFRIDSDTQYRIDMEAGGKIVWGPGGTTAGDTNLYRSAADVLKTDDVFQAASGIVTLTTSGTPSASLSDGAIAVDTTNNKFFFRSGSTWREAGGSGGTVTKSVSFTIPRALQVETGSIRFYFTETATLTNVAVGLNTAPTGASAIFDVNKNGTTIFTTQGNRPTITATNFTDLSSTPDVTSMSSGDYLTVDVDQVGSTVAGSNAVITIYWT